MFKKLSVFLLVSFVFLTQLALVSAKDIAPPSQIQEKGVVISQVSKELDENGKAQSISYVVKLDNGKVITATYQLQAVQTFNVSPGSKVVVLQSKTPQGNQYQIVDLYRLPSLFYFLIAFIIIAVLIIGVKGIGSLLGLLISLLIILYLIVPQIIHGTSPLLITTIGAFIILLVTTYLAHGISKKTTVAVGSTGLSLLITLIISWILIEWLSLSGTGNENIADISLATNHLINAKGLLLSGIIIGTLGALNDVTVTQATTIFEMKKIDHSLSFVALFRRGMNVGREHGASMVNTIVLAYAGSSLFLFIFFIMNPQHLPLWAILNTEYMVEEILVALGGTLGILLSVPIVTLLACYAVARDKKV